MVLISERQKGILDKIVEEYITTAQPVSSQLLEDKYDFDICPASIRLEMQKLTDSGYLYQPYTSAGRAPTDKGYRFFVDNLELGDEFLSEIFDELEKDIDNSFEVVQLVTKKLAENSSAFTFGYISNEHILLKEGLKRVFDEPEFKETDFVSSFLETIDKFEKDIDKFFKDLPQESHVFIGKESPIPKAREFSLITTKVKFSKKQNGMLAIIGPKRMPYQKNISLFKTLNKVLEVF